MRSLLAREPACAALGLWDRAREAGLLSLPVERDGGPERRCRVRSAAGGG